VLPLLLQFGEQVYQDGMTEDTAQFYQTLRAASRPPGIPTRSGFWTAPRRPW